MTTEGLPLPEPAIKAWGERVGPYLESDHYTADQIREYAAQAVKAARAAERERCAKVAEGEALVDPTHSTDDLAYDCAVKDCAAAIRAMKD